MKRLLIMFFSAAVFSLGGVAFTPGDAAAQCQWGCTCMGNACGCNSNGGGSRCDTGGSGCVVTMCDVQVTLHFAPDGSLVEPPRQEDDDPTALVRLAKHDGHVRREPISDEWSVERHCSGLVLSRQLGSKMAAAIRREAQRISI